MKYHAELLNYIDVPVLDIHGKQKQIKRTSTFNEFVKAEVRSGPSTVTLSPPPLGHADACCGTHECSLFACAVSIPRAGRWVCGAPNL